MLPILLVLNPLPELIFNMMRREAERGGWLVRWRPWIIIVMSATASKCVRHLLLENEGQKKEKKREGNEEKRKCGYGCATSEETILFGRLKVITTVSGFLLRLKRRVSLNREVTHSSPILAMLCNRTIISSHSAAYATVILKHVKKWRMLNNYMCASSDNFTSYNLCVKIQRLSYLLSQFSIVTKKSVSNKQDWKAEDWSTILIPRFSNLRLPTQTLEFSKSDSDALHYWDN